MTMTSGTTSIRFVLAFLITAAFQDSGTSAQTQTCPGDANVTGFTSIGTINNFMDDELARISAGGVPQDEYVITLCPQQTFSAAAEPLRPVLDGVVFQCGDIGVSTDSCTILGGSEQVLVEDSTVTNYTLSQVTFQGVTFASFTNNAGNTGASINVLASDTTSLDLTDVIWRSFDSQYIVNKQGAATVTIEDATVTDGEISFAFNADGGTLDISGLQTTGLTGEALISLENAGESTLSSSTIGNSSLTRVTTASSGGIQDVVDTTVSNMQALQDVFFGAGSNTEVDLLRTIVENNSLDGAWRILNVRDGAVGRASQTTVAENSGISFAFSASSVATTLVVNEVLFIENTGRGPDVTSAIVIGRDGATVTMTDTIFNENVDFTSQVLGFFGSDISITRNCFDNTESSFVVFVDNQSTGTASTNFVSDTVESRDCPAPGNRLFKEDDGSACFQGGLCEGECDILASEATCPNTIPVRTDSPTPGPTTDSPTTNPSAAPSGMPSVSAAPSNSFAPTTGTPAPTGTPTTVPTVSASPTEFVPTSLPSTSAPSAICPGGKLVKQRKHKPKKKLSQYGRPGVRRKKQKDIHPTYWQRPDQWSFHDVTYDHVDDEESEYYYIIVCPPEDSDSSKKSSKVKSASKSKSAKSSSRKMGKGKWTPRSVKSDKDHKRALWQNDNEGGVMTGVRRQRS